MSNILELNGIVKTYKDFTLGPVDLELSCGVVMGLVGANGAGKTTMMKMILGLARPDSGSVKLLGSSAADSSLHERVGVVFDELALPPSMTAAQAGKVMEGIYSGWDAACYKGLLSKFSLPADKQNKDFSRGMKMKLAIAIAMSHNAELLLLDEPTGGLDPLVRGEILDIFRDFMQDERHGILISSHITGDLARIADYITYIDGGKLLMTEEKDRLLEEYGVAKGRSADLDGLDRSELIGLRQGTNGFEALVRDKDTFAKAQPAIVVDRVDLDDIMTFVVGEARK